MELAVEMMGITMQFPRVLANDHVDFSVYAGEIHALVGENGAGKSTLMNILYGLYEPTAGRIRIKGQEVRFHSAIDAIKMGIGMVHQHFMLIHRLSVVDNIALGEEPQNGLRYDRAEAVRKVDALCREFEIHINPKAKVREISLGMQQRVEIMKAIYRKAEIIIFDEPTAVLTPQEINDLGVMLKKLQKMGKTIIIITHKLQEVIDFSDRVTVLRNGRIVGTRHTRQTSPEEITQMMVGRSVKLGGVKETVPGCEKMLQMNSVSYHDGRSYKLKDISLFIQRGEILGIAGIDNSGQKELTEIVAGILKPQTGSITLEEKNVTGLNARQMKKLGVEFIPQDRQKHGLALNHSVGENMILGHQDQKRFLKNRYFMNTSEIKRAVAEFMQNFDIRPAQPEIPAKNLSGGNQQKVIVARAVSYAKKLIVANQPTRGVDIGAIELIHRMLVDARNQGKSVLLVSLELDELLMLSDRIAVLHQGELMDVVMGNTATREQIGLLMTGHRY